MFQMIRRAVTRRTIKNRKGIRIYEHSYQSMVGGRLERELGPRHPAGGVPFQGVSASSSNGSLPQRGTPADQTENQQAPPANNKSHIQRHVFIYLHDCRHGDILKLTNLMVQGVQKRTDCS